MIEKMSERLARHVEHVQSVGQYCTTEETTKQALILPLLDILGFSAFDPTKCRAEYQADFPGAKNSERVDYALFYNGLPVMFVEAKAFNQNLTNHSPQLSRYFNSTPEVTVSAITNGREWRFFTDLGNRNVMDSAPFLTIHLDRPSDELAEQLHRFHHDQFKPDSLRALAEESIFLSAFKDAIGSALREVDMDFVRFVLTKANIQRTYTQRFLDQVQPIVKQAVARSISSLITTSLSATAEVSVAVKPPTVDEPVTGNEAALVDPTNPKIVTTLVEREIAAVCADVLDGADVQGKDTESYFTVNYQGKSNRWLLRYFGDKKRPCIQLGMPLSEAAKAEIRRAGLEFDGPEMIALPRPALLHRIAGVLRDCLGYAQNDDNYRRKGTDSAAP